MTATATAPTPGPLAAPHPNYRRPAFLAWAERHGMTYPAPGMSVEDVIIAAGMNYRVTLDNVETVDPHTGDRRPMEGRYATVRRDRDGTVTPLAIVGGRYSICQNLTALDYGQGLIDDHGANIAAAAAYGNPLGAKAYLALRSPHTVHVGGHDEHRIFVVISNSHDGTSGLACSLHAIRTETGADMAIDLGSAPQKWTIRHSGDLDEKYADVAATVAMVERWIDSFEGMSRMLLGKRMGPEQIDDYIEALLPTPRNAGTRSATTWAHRRRSLRDLAATDKSTGWVAGTAMSVFHATCQYIDHLAPAKGDNADRVRAERGLTGRNTLAKERAWRLLSQQLHR